MTTAPIRPRYRVSSLLPPLMALVKCCTPADVLGWARHAAPAYEHKTGLSHAFCNECAPDYRAVMQARSLCMTKEINGPNFQPVDDDERDFDAPAFQELAG